ncbi:nicotinate phosphoribosyltransferase [Pontibacter sp. KCTC 32443]|uniref:nicotinate phosphoribosyltransferase n=1 Tax=Pontibacter TaxID=323449 RepID=UPI00164DBD2F|nr:MULTISPECIES: nicotinate phosphoribosyltransferase [Pontibacter]MBC5774204.1 nicotinate phosphoribosyltransferase [Pontibacter sp. KCTC 32443]
MQHIFSTNLASALYTDMYQISMAHSHFNYNRQNEQVSFDYFFRKQPYSGGFTIFSGLGELMALLQEFKFEIQDIDWLYKHNFNDGFLEYLRDFSFNGTVHSMREGEIVFPQEPIVRVEGNIVEAQLVETVLLNYLNFQSLVATKAARIKLVARGAALSEFGLRRAQGIGSMFASRAALTGGFTSTSNVLAASIYGVPAVGTMAHAYIQSYDDELEAFRSFAKVNPEGCVLLVDTYDTLKSGVPNAITVGKEMEKEGHKLMGIRLDSGDLAYLSKQARQMLDAAGLNYVKIVASNQLDELIIKSLFEQGAPIDIFGVGTNLATGKPDAALDGVYKLSMADGEPRLKLSENIKKTTLPGLKQVYRYHDDAGNFVADAIALEGDAIPDFMFHPYEPEKSMSLEGYKATPLLQPVMKDGKPTAASPSVLEVADYATERLGKLTEEYKRFENPHIYKVGVSKPLYDLRATLRSKYKKDSL